MIRRAPSETRARFTIVPNVTLEDARLSWEAIGMLAYLLSKPDHWKISPAHLVNQRKAGRSVVYRILAELEQAGYIERVEIREAGQFAGIDRLLHDTASRSTASQESASGESTTSKDSLKVKTENYPCAAGAARARDELWDAVTAACGWSEQITSAERGRLAKAVKDLRSVQATLEQVAERAAEHRARWQGKSVTPTSLAANWSTLAPERPAEAKRERPYCPECRGSGWTIDENAETIRCACIA